MIRFALRSFRLFFIREYHPSEMRLGCGVELQRINISLVRGKAEDLLVKAGMFTLSNALPSNQTGCQLRLHTISRVLGWEDLRGFWLYPDGKYIVEIRTCTLRVCEMLALVMLLC